MSIRNVVDISSVEEAKTKTGRQFMKVIDQTGTNYTVWEPGLIRAVRGLTGKRVSIEFEESVNGQYTNRSVRGIQVLEGSAPSVDTDVSATGDAAPKGNEGDGGADKWEGIVRRAAQQGDWRAADALLRHESIERSVALNNAISFFNHLAPEDKKLSNLSLVVEHMASALRDLKDVG